MRTNREASIKLVEAAMKEFPEGIFPKDLYEHMSHKISLDDFRDAMSIMWYENNSLLGVDRKLKWNDDPCEIYEF